MANSADPDQLASVCKGRVCPGSAGQGLSIRRSLTESLDTRECIHIVNAWMRVGLGGSHPKLLMSVRTAQDDLYLQIILFLCTPYFYFSNTNHLY